jgi:hypothetical protein
MVLIAVIWPYLPCAEFFDFGRLPPVILSVLLVITLLYAATSEAGKPPLWWPNRAHDEGLSVAASPLPPAGLNTIFRLRR